MMRPKPEYEQKAFTSVLEFVRGASRVIPETVVTAIDGASVDIVKFEALAKELGVKTRIRARLEI